MGAYAPRKEGANLHAPANPPLHRAMQSQGNRARVDILISALGLIAALSLSIAVLGRLWSYLPLLYTTVFSMIALRVLYSTRGQLFVEAPLGYRVLLPAGSLVFSAKRY